MKDKQIELVAPAGSFSAAVYALLKGADAVYAGLQAFSARQHALNLDLDQLSRLKRFTEEKHKKLYVTLNTIIREDELNAIFALLVDLAFLQVDGVIIQDPGLLPVLKKYFPGLPVHASTQMAVHNTDGVKYLQQAGVKRVVLSRELSLNRIEEIRDKVQDVELEVFIHGALCYGFSGLCLTSGLLLGRSGNRGDCAQVCRSWFTHKNTRSYFFSCNDLALKEQVCRLKEAGVDALKIEGRMKSPEYAGLTAAYYRSILAGEAPGESAAYLEKIRLSFSRNQTTGFFTRPAEEELINTAYPSHTGVFAGTVRAAQPDHLLLHLAQPVSTHEGLLFFAGKNPVQPVRFGIKKINADKKTVFTAQTGAQVRVESNLPFPALPSPGDPVYKISSQELNWPAVKPASYPSWKSKIRGTVILSGQSLTFQAAFGDNPVFKDTPAGACACSMEAAPQAAQGSKNFGKLLAEILSRSGNALFEITGLNFINQSGIPGMPGLPDTGIFIQPSLLKKFKNQCYATLQNFYRTRQEDIVRQITSEFCTGKKQDRILDTHAAAVFPRSICHYTDLRLPFVIDPAGLESAALPLYQGKQVIALHPITDNPHTYFSGLIAFLEKHQNGSCLIGLNNFTHLPWVEELLRFPGVSFFIDYGLYCANRCAYLYYTEQVKRLEFILYWIEGSTEHYRELAAGIADRTVPLLKVDAGFKPHLFLSKVCFRQQSLKKSCGDCTGHYTYRLEQNKKAYRVVVKNCLTYMFDDGAV